MRNDRLLLRVLLVGSSSTTPFRHEPRVPPARPARLPFQELSPPTVVGAAHLLVAGAVRGEASVHADLRRLVPAEEGGVNLDATNPPARNAQLDDNPVKRGGVVSPRLPPVVPRPRGHVDAGLVHWRARVEQVASLCEELIREGEDAGRERRRGEVCTTLLISSSRERCAWKRKEKKAGLANAVGEVDQFLL